MYIYRWYLQFKFNMVWVILMGNLGCKNAFWYLKNYGSYGKYLKISTQQFRRLALKIIWKCKILQINYLPNIVKDKILRFGTNRCLESAQAIYTTCNFLWIHQTFAHPETCITDRYLAIVLGIVLWPAILLRSTCVPYDYL